MQQSNFLRLSDAALDSNTGPAITSGAIPAKTVLAQSMILTPFFPQISASVPEAEAPFPICPQSAPTDTVVYRDGKDSSKTFFLQRYRLRHSSQGRYEIAHKAESDGLWSMRFGLEMYPATEVAEAARASQPLFHKLAVSLRYVMTTTSIQKEFPAFAVTGDTGGTVVEFRLTLEERDAVLRAFRSETLQARLVIARQIDVCIPALPKPTEDSPPLPPKHIAIDRVILPIQSAPVRPGTLSVHENMVAFAPEQRIRLAPAIMRDHRDRADATLDFAPGGVRVRPTAAPLIPDIFIPITPPSRLNLQQDWSWCNKCQGLFYGPGVSSSVCPVGGTHAPPAQSQSGNYSLPYNAAPDPSRQSDWRWCNKCQGLFFGRYVENSRCVAGGTHQPAAESGSWDYSLPHNVPPDPSHQSDWRWCNKCQGLFFGGGVAASHCPAGDTHTAPEQSGSANYSLPHRTFSALGGTTPPIPPPSPRVVPIHLVLDNLIALNFDPAVHPEAFPSNIATSQRPEIEHILLPYPPNDPNRLQHSYFQDMTKPNLFFYLPDSFKLSRRPTAPFVPSMAIDFVQNESSHNAHVTVTAGLRPAVDSARLDAAKIALKAHIPVSSGTTSTEPELQPLQAKAVLKLGLPRSGQVKTIETDAVVDLVNGFLVNEDFSLPDFQAVFAALNGPSTSGTFRGDVDVSTGLGTPVHIEVTVRFADMEGNIFVGEERTDSAGETVTATLRNATESPLKIEALPVWLERSSVKVQGQISGLDLSTPLPLEPNASIEMTIRPTQPLPGQGALDAIFDLSRVRSLPDPQKLLASIVNQSVLPEALRSITVVTSPEVFADKGSPEKSISYIGIEFLGGPQVLLRANEFEKEVHVPIPLIDWLLPRDTGGSYSYRTVIGFKSGTASTPSSWIQTNLGILSVGGQ